MYWFQVRSLKNYFFTFSQSTVQLVQEEFLGVYRKKTESDIVWLFRLFENKIDLALIHLYYTYPWNLMIMVDGLMYLLA